MEDYKFTALDYCLNCTLLDFICSDKSFIFETSKSTETFFMIAKNINKFDGVLSWGIEKDIISITDLVSFAEICKSVKIDIYKKSSILKKEIESIESKLINISPEKFYSYGSTQEVQRSLSLLSLKNNYDFTELGRTTFSYNGGTWYMRRSPLRKLAKLWSLSNKKTFVSFYNSTNFKYEKRSILSYGLAFTKVDNECARKMRSECQAVSLGFVEGLIESQSIYSELEFAQIVSQFADSRHLRVVEYLASNLPLKNLNVLLANPLTPSHKIQNRLSK